MIDHDRPNHRWHKQKVKLTSDNFYRSISHKLIEIRNWCENSFGNQWDIRTHRDGIWIYRWSHNEGEGRCYVFIFRDKEDAIQFSLRWR